MKELNRKNQMLKNKKVASKYKIILVTAFIISCFFSSFNSLPTAIYSESLGLPLFPCLVRKKNKN